MTRDPHELPPPMLKDAYDVPPPRDTDRPGPHIVAEVIPLEGQLKVGHVQGFTVKNCSFNGVSSTSNTFKNVDNRSFTNVKINGKTVT